MLFYAWVLYFAIWTLAFWMQRLPKSKIVFALVWILSLADLVYLGMHDLRTLALVLLATVFAACGVARSIVLGLRAVKEEE